MSILSQLNRESRRALKKCVKYNDATGFTATEEFARICFKNGLQEKDVLIEIAKEIANGDTVAERLAVRKAKEYLFKQSMKGNNLDNNNTWAMLDEFYETSDLLMSLPERLKEPAEALKEFVPDPTVLDTLIQTMDKDISQLREEVDSIRKMHQHEDGTPFTGEITLDQLPEMFDIANAQHTVMHRYEEVVTPVALQIEELIHEAAKAEALQNGENPDEVERPNLVFTSDEYTTK